MKKVLILSMALAVLASCKGGVPQAEYVAPAAPVMKTIGNITITQRSRVFSETLRSRAISDSAAQPVVVTCNGGTTTITCPDGMTDACIAVVREYCD